MINRTNSTSVALSFKVCILIMLIGYNTVKNQPNKLLSNKDQVEMDIETIWYGPKIKHCLTF